MSTISLIDLVKYHLNSAEFLLSQIDIGSLNDKVADNLQQKMESVCKVYNQQLDYEPKSEFTFNEDTVTTEPEAPKEFAHFEEEIEEPATPTRRRGRPPKSTRSGRGVAKTQEAYEKQQQGRRLGGKRSAEVRKSKQLASQVK